MDLIIKDNMLMFVSSISMFNLLLLVFLLLIAYRDVKFLY